MLTLIWYGTRRLGNPKDSVSSAMKTRGAQFWLLTILMGSRWVCLLSRSFPLCRVSVSFPSWWLQAQGQYWSAGLQRCGDILTGKWPQEIIPLAHDPVSMHSFPPSLSKLCPQEHRYRDPPPTPLHLAPNQASVSHLFLLTLHSHFCYIGEQTLLFHALLYQGIWGSIMVLWLRT